MMPTLDLKLDGDGCWPDLGQIHQAGKLLNAMGNDTVVGLALLPGGMASGEASVTIRLDLPDGRVVIAETSFALLENAVNCMRIRLGQFNETN
jgi:hypothetical protein